jgi:cytochrome c-type biogenesis protein CcmH
MSRRGFPRWTLLGVVLVVALVIGSGVLSSAPPTKAQRAAAIESVVRCPSCEDLSVANSSASTAVAVRSTIRELVDQGRSEPQIETYLMARYGSSIVLDPPSSGWSLLVWLLPLLGGSVAVVGLAVFLFRRRGPVVADPRSGPEALPVDETLLEERRRFLGLSLADADAEFLAGDLADHDYLALRQREMIRMEAVDSSLRQVRESRPEPMPVGGPVGAVIGGTGSKRSRRSWWFLGGAVAAFGGALIVAVALFSSDRLPGQTATGSINLSPGQKVDETLAQAATDQNGGQTGQAAQLYQSVLSGHPDNEVALAQLGWLEYETGRQGSSASLIVDGRSKLDRAARLDPHDYAVRLYLGTVLLQQDADAAGAVDQYRQFLGDGPPPALVEQATAEIDQAYREADLPLPALPGGG